MIEFEMKEWFNQNDTENQGKRIPISADNLNRIEKALSATVNHANDMTNHWWEKNEIREIKVQLVSYQHDVYAYLWADANATSTLYYSRDVETGVNLETGEVYIELKKPTQKTISYNILDEDSIGLSGMYFIIGSTSTKDGAQMYYGGGMGAKRNYDSGLDYGCHIGGTRDVAAFPLYSRIDLVSKGESDAYKEGWSSTDKAFYRYLGVPFENSIGSMRIATGWYIGDGAGERKITLSCKPKLILLYQELDDDYKYEISWASYCLGIATEEFSSGGIRWYDDGFMVGTEYHPNTNAGVSYSGKVKYIYIVFY